jgi:hypothetical protein
MDKQVSKYVRYKRDGFVGIWFIEDRIAAIEEADISKAEEHYRRVASTPVMKSVIIVLGAVGEVTDEVLYHVSDIWTEIDVGVKVVAYVTEDCSIGSTVQQLMKEGSDVDGVAKAFDDIEEAVEWAKEQQQKFSE